MAYLKHISIAVVVIVLLAFWFLFPQNSAQHVQVFPLSDISFVDKLGAKHRLDALKGKVVLMNFWATWCGPCVQELPDLDSLQQELGGDDFVVLPVSMDAKGWDVVGPFFKQHSILHLDSVYDPDFKAFKNLEVKGMPTSILIDSEGHEVWRVNGILDLVEVKVKLEGLGIRD